MASESSDALGDPGLPDGSAAPERRRGRVRLRRRQVEATTTDQHLLDSRGPTDWVHQDPWRVLRIQAEFVEDFLHAHSPTARWRPA